MEENKTKPGVVLERFQDVVNRDTPGILQKIVANLKPLLIGAAVIVAIAAGIAGYRMIQARNLASAQEALGSILAGNTGKEKVAALEKFLPGAPSGLRSAVLFELAGASMNLKDFDKAAGYWADLAAHSDGDERVVAKLGRAHALTRAGKAAEAVKELEALKQDAPEAFAVPVTRQLALAAEAAGDRQAALAAYEALAKFENIGDRPFIESKIAQLKAAK
ncbi:tetratricopeptide repeat protein [Desulfovibrio aminophilus]|nr:tetratricopeptide repeat protein [Desulfovibrio aminophilus]MCM0756751.1 tetratricopeptide repeat protein [Desulfovibrio aminophilus]